MSLGGVSIFDEYETKMSRISHKSTPDCGISNRDIEIAEAYMLLIIECVDRFEGGLTG